MPEAVIYEAIGHCFEKLKNPAQARFHYRKAAHLNVDDSHLYYKIAMTYMQEGYWESAVKNLNSALSINRSQPDYQLALAQCFLELDHIKEAVIHFTQFIKARPRNSKGWKELINCLYEAGYYEEALEQAENAYENTNQKALFTYYKSVILFSLGKAKEGLIQLTLGIEAAPLLVKHFIEMDPSLLQRPAIADIISANKPASKKRKK